MLIFDIGANIGNYSISNNIDNTVIAVEASPITFELLKNNVAKYNNITPINFAVSSFTDSSYIIFYHCVAANTISTLDKNWLTSPESRFYNFRNTIQEVMVKTISIDKLIDLYGMPDLIKVDVEGAEYHVIKSLTKKINILCFEWASEWKDDILNTLDYLTSLGYTKYHIQIKDDYKYKPSQYNMSIEDVKLYINNSIPKEDWGMIWAI
jgi:FkbM family methyltransferase